MTGEELLNEVRYLIEDTSYSRYTELNQAFRKICRTTKFFWLRKSDENLFTFNASQDEYLLDTKHMRRLERIWVYGVANNKQRWHHMTEVRPDLFEEKKRVYRNSDGTDDTARPIYYKLEGGPVTTVTVTPTPDQAYNVRVDYIAHIEEIERDKECAIPSAYHDIITHLAAGFILERSKQEMEIIRGNRLVSRAMEELTNLVADSHPRRTPDIDRTPQTWIR